MTNRLELGGRCSNGHLLTDGTLHFDNRGKAFCNTCAKDRKKKWERTWRKNNPEKYAAKERATQARRSEARREVHVAEIAEWAESARIMGIEENPDQRKDRIADARKHATEVSQDVGLDVTSTLPRPTAMVAYKQFKDALDAGAARGVYSNCNDKEDRFAFYGDDEIPSDAQAEMWCHSCVFKKQCGTYSDIERPAWGIWNSKVWGRQNILLDEEERNEKVQGR